MRIAAPSLLLLLAATAPALPNGARLEQRQRAQAEAGDEIIVYRSKEGESLQSIAGQGLPRAAPGGAELLADMPLGTSRAIETASASRSSSC